MGCGVYRASSRSTFSTPQKGTCERMSVVENKEIFVPLLAQPDEKRSSVELANRFIYWVKRTIHTALRTSLLTFQTVSTRAWTNRHRTLINHHTLAFALLFRQSLQD